MSRKRMSWNWVGDYPVFVYTVWIDHKVFNVDIIIGEKGNQNAGNTGPNDEPDHSYVQTGLRSKAEVAENAFRVAKNLIKRKEEESNAPK